MVRGRYRVGVSKTKTKEKIMMKKKVMPLSCLMAAAMLAGCGTAAPAVPEETTAPAVETAEAAQETAPADAAESEAAAVEKTAGVWQVEPCYNFDEIVPLYSEWDHTAGKNAADGLYAVRDGERWSLFSTKTGNIMMQDAAQQMPYLYGTNELSVWLDDEYYNYDNFAAMREKCEGLNAELQANGAEIEVLYDGVGGYANRWIYTEDGQIYYDLLGTYEFSGTPLVQVSDASALFGVRPATWDNEYRCYTVANGAPYAVARSDGSLLSSFRYKNVCMAGDELIAVEDTDGNWGYCDINGEEVIPCTYQAAMQAEGASEPIVCFQLVRVERNVQLAQGVVPLCRDRHVALQVDGRHAVGKPYADDRQQSHGRHRQGQLAGVLLCCLCFGGCIAAHTAAAVGAESLAVVDLFTTMYTNHFIFPPCFVPAVLLGLFCFPYTLSIGSGLGHVKADLKKFCRTKK